MGLSKLDAHGAFLLRLRSLSRPVCRLPKPALIGQGPRYARPLARVLASLRAAPPRHNAEVGQQSPKAVSCLPTALFGWLVAFVRYINHVFCQRGPLQTLGARLVVRAWLVFLV